MTAVVIVSAARTPVGAFSSAPAHELGKTAISAAVLAANAPCAER